MLPVTFELHDMLEKVRSGNLVVIYPDPVFGPQVRRIGDDGRPIHPNTPVYAVPNLQYAAALIAAKHKLDEGDEKGAYALLATEIADETRHLQSH
jgi:hypothetical protein